MSLSEYTAAELALLTPDERAAMEADDGSDLDDITELADGADDDTDTDTDESTGDGEEGTDDTDEAKDDKPADETTPEAEAEAAAAGDDVDAGPKFVAPSDLADKRAKLNKESDEAFAQLMDGTIETAEYLAIKNRTTAELEAITKIEVRAEAAAEAHEAAIQQAWKDTLKTFFNEAKTQGADYLAKPEQHKEFDGLVKIFAAEAQAKNMSDAGFKASKYALEQAHMVMSARHGFKPAGKQATAGEKAIAAANKLRHGVQTLANMPAADKLVTDDTPLAKIATLEGPDLEAYMATLSPAEMRRLEAATS